MMAAEHFLREGESLDDLQIKGYKLIQKENGFRYGIDAVLLSDYVRAKTGSRIMDLCSGTGVVAFLMEAKYRPAYVEGLEYQADYAEMAGRTSCLNQLEGRVMIRQGDVKEVRNRYESGSFDYVTCNPPYMIGSHGQASGNREKAIARHEITCTLSDVVKGARWLLRFGGHFVMVHRPFRLAEIMYTLKNNQLEPKRMRLVHSRPDREPNMVLIDSVMGGNSRITVDPPLIVYEEDGSYTEEIRRIYGLAPGDPEEKSKDC